MGGDGGGVAALGLGVGRGLGYGRPHFAAIQGDKARGDSSQGTQTTWLHMAYLPLPPSRRADLGGNLQPLSRDPRWPSGSVRLPFPGHIPGGRPLRRGLSLSDSELRNGLSVEVAVLGSPTPTVITVSADGKATVSSTD